MLNKIIKNIFGNNKSSSNEKLPEIQGYRNDTFGKIPKPIQGSRHDYYNGPKPEEMNFELDEHKGTRSEGNPMLQGGSRSDNNPMFKKDKDAFAAFNSNTKGEYSAKGSNVSNNVRINYSNGSYSNSGHISNISHSNY